MALEDINMKLKLMKILKKNQVAENILVNFLSIQKF